MYCNNITCQNKSGMSNYYSLHTDGGARGNPGLAAIGAVLRDPDGNLVDTYNAFIGISTNNIAEYTALIQGLRLARMNNVENLNCYLDSELVVKQLNGEYKVKDENLKILKQRVDQWVNQFKNVTFNHVPRKNNKNADTLVNEALDENF